MLYNNISEAAKIAFSRFKQNIFKQFKAKLAKKAEYSKLYEHFFANFNAEVLKKMKLKWFLIQNSR